MNCYLKELNLDMGKDVYEMYQDIPAKESGSTNECFGLSFDDFPKYLEKEINRKYNEVTYDDTPTISYIMYDDNKPIRVSTVVVAAQHTKKISLDFRY